MKKKLYILLAHIDDFECSCFGYLFKHYKKYEQINIVIATTWPSKVPIWEENLKLLLFLRTLFPSKLSLQRQAFEVKNSMGPNPLHEKPSLLLLCKH